MPAVGHAGDGKAVVAAAHRIAHHAIELAEIVRPIPWPVQMHRLAGNEHVAGTERRRHAGDRPGIAEAANLDLPEILVELVDDADVDSADRREIAIECRIRPFAVRHPLHDLRYDEIGVGITLAMRVGAHVDRHVIDEEADIGAMVEREAAQEILIGFSSAAVLGDDEARHAFEHLARHVGRSGFQLLLGYDALARGTCNVEQ